MESLNATSIEAVKAAIPRMKTELVNELKAVYAYTFNFAKTPGQKSLGASF
jgi:hypothetical protein